MPRLDEAPRRRQVPLPLHQPEGSPSTLPTGLHQQGPRFKGAVDAAGETHRHALFTRPGRAGARFAQLLPGWGRKQLVKPDDLNAETEQN